MRIWEDPLCCRLQTKSSAGGIVTNVFKSAIFSMLITFESDYSIFLSDEELYRFSSLEAIFVGDSQAEQLEQRVNLLGGVGFVDSPCVTAKFMCGLFALLSCC